LEEGTYAGMTCFVGKIDLETTVHLLHFLQGLLPFGFLHRLRREGGNLGTEKFHLVQRLLPLLQSGGKLLPESSNLPLELFLTCLPELLESCNMLLELFIGLVIRDDTFQDLHVITTIKQGLHLDAGNTHFPGDMKLEGLQNSFDTLTDKRMSQWRRQQHTHTTQFRLTSLRARGTNFFCSDLDPRVS
jgi:hypothetical protein